MRRRISKARPAFRSLSPPRGNSLGDFVFRRQGMEMASDSHAGMA